MEMNRAEALSVPAEDDGEESGSASVEAQSNAESTRSKGQGKRPRKKVDQGLPTQAPADEEQS